MTPQRVFNILTLTGNSNELEKFRLHAEGIDPCVLGRFYLNDFCFNNFIALPNAVIQGTSMIEMETSRINVWGCASDALGVSLEESPDKLIYMFTTGKCPPKKVLDKINLLYGSGLNIVHKTR